MVNIILYDERMDSLRQELFSIFQRLNQLIAERNLELKKLGSPPIKKQSVNIVGQVALILSALPFTLTSTMDVDVVSKLDFWVQQTLDKLLLEQGMHLEKDGHLIWMPEDTSYEKILDLTHVELRIATAEDVIASKQRFNRKKDSQLILQYLTEFPLQKEIIQKKAKGK